jgi:glycosyltransferase involved in cell wall biosynthesis
VPRKGYDVLLAALAQVRDLSWRLTIVGARDRSPATAAEVDAAVAELDLAHRVNLAGVVSPERLAALYAEADVFVLPSRFEGYGMAFAEALAHGVPVIGTTAGAIPETVPAGAGILVAPDDVAALATALRLLITNGEERLRLAACARAAATQLPTWPQSARLFSRVLEAVA